MPIEVGNSLGVVEIDLDVDMNECFVDVGNVVDVDIEMFDSFLFVCCLEF